MRATLSCVGVGMLSSTGDPSVLSKARTACQARIALDNTERSGSRQRDKTEP